jgi:hypothetical protein
MERATACKRVKPKKATKAQSERFVARELGVSETGAAFQQLFTKLLSSKSEK